MRAQIRYLSTVRVDTGRPHTGADRQIGGRVVPVDDQGYEVPTRCVDPTEVDLIGIAIPDGIEVRVGWGDRVKRGETPPVWVSADGKTISEAELPEGLLDTIRARVAEAWHADIETREDVASAVEDYRASVLDVISLGYAAHAARWARDCARIAKKFRRARVVVGEQTIPGKCVVRSTRGRTLGYADVWDGVWQGTVEQVR